MTESVDQLRKEYKHFSQGSLQAVLHALPNATLGFGCFVRPRPLAVMR
jgi:hypothetical protein